MILLKQMLIFLFMMLLGYGMARKGVLDIPLLFILDRLWPLYGCMAVKPVVDAISLVIALVFYFRINAENRAV